MQVLSHRFIALVDIRIPYLFVLRVSCRARGGLGPGQLCTGQLVWTKVRYIPFIYMATAHVQNATLECACTNVGCGYPGVAIQTTAATLKRLSMPPNCPCLGGE